MSVGRVKALRLEELFPVSMREKKIRDVRHSAVMGSYKINSGMPQLKFEICVGDKFGDKFGVMSSLNLSKNLKFMLLKIFSRDIFKDIYLVTAISREILRFNLEIFRKNFQRLIFFFKKHFKVMLCENKFS